ncbi:hypothetical protein ABZ858_28975 [Streptomyces sp. NPDC047017]|uniref:hypothetical protein n=1 Tax=Streptomyces sp. NPDC047017 TaxID=3155024 RepID=UPI0033F12095
METRERARLNAYFARITRQFAPPAIPASLLVTHLLPERPAFVRAVGAVSNLRGVLPKPKSVDRGAKREVERTFAVDELSRERFADPVRAGIAPLLPGPVHIDVHDIPANDAKGEPAHRHADVRYLFRTTGPVEMTLQEEEISASEWRSPDLLTDALLRARVLAALR